MSIIDWSRNTANRVSERGISGVSESFYMLYNGGWRLCCSRLPLGTNVFDRDWDLLVLLDGCRVDTLEHVADETDIDYIDSVDSHKSVASTSREWLAKTFTPDKRPEIENTAYVSSNPYTEEILSSRNTTGSRSPFNPANWDTVDREDFLFLDEVWRDGWNDELGTVPPRTVTDRAISAGREREPEQLIVHYMQPHQPFIGEQARSDDNAWIEGNCWDALRRNDVTVERVMEAYRENLSVVLNDVELLLQNVEAETAVISADHGNAFGEWGIYGHPNGFLHPSVKEVPWVETEGRDTRTYEPTSELSANKTQRSTEERLQDLGYL